jgi:hypothetical protein
MTWRLLELAARSRELELPSVWVEHALAGLRRVSHKAGSQISMADTADNLYLAELEQCFSHVSPPVMTGDQILIPSRTSVK